MKKFFAISYCSVFFSLILAPTVLMPWRGHGPAENRQPAPAPQLIVDGRINASAPLEAEEFFNDRFAGRTIMIDAYSRFLGSVFAVSANEKVIIGKDGWLFFHETVPDFDGSAALDDTQMSQLIQDLLEMKRAAESRGQTFIIAVAPNKNTLYGSYMPRRYKETDAPTNLGRLLAARELECIDFGAALLAAHDGHGQYVYYKTDSHWNGLGAHVAAREIMLAIEEKTGVSSGLGPGGIPDSAFETGEKTGDLGQMLYPANPPKETDFIFEQTRQRYTALGRYRSLDDMHITTESGGAPLRIAMYRDSFANSLIPYISNAYSSVYYTRQTPPPTERDEFAEADVIIFEIAERRLAELVE